MKGFVAKAGTHCTGFRASGSCRVCTLFVLLRAGPPVGPPTAQLRPARGRGPVLLSTGLQPLPESTQELATSGSRAREQLPHGQPGALLLSEAGPASGAPQCSWDALLTNWRKAWVGCRGPASTWELRPDPCGGACRAHSWPRLRTSDQLQATAGARENLTPSTPAPRGDKYGQRRLLPKRSFNKVPKILCQK